MKDYTTDDPIFARNIKVLETGDPGHADNVNVTTKQLLQNTLYLYDCQNMMADADGIESAFQQVFFGNGETSADETALRKE